MASVTLNPGFVLFLAALGVLALPRAARAPAMGATAFLAMWLLLGRQFGAADAIAQMGLPVILLSLDELNRVFGIALLIALALIAIYSSFRSSRGEDAAILVMAGGAISALFMGDLVSFVAAASLAALSGAWLTFGSEVEGADRAAVRFLVWNGLEGLCMLIGVALRLSAGASASVLGRLDAEGAGESLILAGLLLRVGAPLAHVWFKDVVSHASATGAAAFTAFSMTVGLYGLARFFPGETILVPVGIVMIGVGLFFCAADTDLRRSAAYALGAQFGVCVALIGVGSPLALAAAQAGLFAAVLSFGAVQMSLGGMLIKLNSTQLSALGGAFHRLPATSSLLFLAGLAASGAPGFAGFAAQNLALAATGEWQTRLLWALIPVMSGVTFISLALRPLVAATEGARSQQRDEAPFPVLLASLLAVFLSLLVGLAPSWLYYLLPGEISFDLMSPAVLARALQVFGVAGLVFLGLAKLGAGRPSQSSGALWDVDKFYAGPLAQVAAVGGKGISWAAQTIALALEAAMAHVGRLLRSIAVASDRPHALAPSVSLFVFIVLCSLSLLLPRLLK